MKKQILLLLAFNLFLGHLAYSQCGNLFIAGVIDGGLSGGLPKGIQVCATGDIVDMSIYGLGSANNGGGSDGEEFTFDALSAGNGDCFWIASETTQFTNFFGFAPCYVTSAANINGDDAIELFCNGAVADLFGDIGTDGTGQCWEYLDGWAANNTGAPNNGAFDCADWTFSGINALDGETTNASAATPYPNDVPQVCPSAPAPVSLSHFMAEVKSQSVQLNWITESEQNNDYFAIEYSTDGQDFTQIEFVQGAGTSFATNNYEYLHRNPAKGSNYYRLAQVDYNRNISYSPVEVVTLKGADLFTLYPTQAKDEITLAFEEAITETATIEVFDLLGRKVIQNKIDDTMLNWTFPVSDLQTGHYLVRVNTEGQAHTARFIKQ